MKHIFRFLRTESPKSWRFILAMGILSGLLSGALLAIINAAAVIASATQDVNTLFLARFLVILAALFYAKRKALIRTTVIVENMLKDLRVRVSDKIRQSELVYFEPIQKTDAFTKIAYDTNSISEASLGMTTASQSLITLFVSLAYLAWLSKPAFIISLVVFVVIVISYSSRRRKLGRQMNEVIGLESRLLGCLNHVFDGFKELKMNQSKSDDLFGTFRETAEKNCAMKVNIGTMFIVNMLLSEGMFFLLLAVLIFILPRYLPNYSDRMLQITSTIMFITGPLSVLIGSAPVFARAETALGNLYSLEEAVDDAYRKSHPNGAPVERAFDQFEQIVLDQATFSYRDTSGVPTFSVGPLTLEVKRGEILFLVGGNGSGKSTVLKLLTSLYQPATGSLRVDRQVIQPSTWGAYRELFSIIFTDFHLFDQLYGLPGGQTDRVTELIREMELEDKVTFSDGRFSTLNLSTGQRKRLALITALIEDRPIYVFDEWAADQDQHFRKHFYEVILKNLRDRGKTIIAVTHDDRYWGHADRIIKLDEGRIAALTPAESAAG